MVANILITTLALAFIQALFVVPLANHFITRKLQEPAYAHLQGVSDLNELTDEQKAELEQLKNNYFVLADVIVLSIIGFLAGLIFGVYFVGISLQARGWPGLICFIFFSLLGSSLHTSLMGA